jgi:general secretion pathway protein B
VALVLGAIVAVLVVLLRREPATPVSTPASMPALVSSSVPSPRVVEQPEPAAPIVPVSNPVAEPESVPTVNAAVPAADPKAAVDKIYATEEAEPQAVADRGVTELYAAEAATTAAVSETIVDPFNPSGSAETISATGQEPVPLRTFDSIKNVPDFNDLPWNMRQKIPTISYARHNYLANGVSSVVINNQTSGVGNIIGTGQFIVQEIYVDGVILKHGNAMFKLRALTGWINM